MKKQLCEWCKNSFENSRGKKTCSIECNNKRRAVITGRYLSEKIPSGTTGAISELSVSSKLLLKGYSVFRALSPSCFCDLIAIKDNIRLSIEVRTGYINPTTKNLTFPKKIHKNADIYAIWERNSGEVYCFDKQLKEYKL